MTQTWKVTTEFLHQDAAVPLVERLEEALDGEPVVVSTFETDPAAGWWTVEVYFQDRVPSEADLERLFGTVRRSSERLPDADWVSHSQSQLTPIRAGRFFVHGAHDRSLRPAAGISIEIQAGQAFGTGHHGTTRGCLLAIDDVLRRACPARALDVGCGSAVLAIAFALATRRRVLASDIDPVAVAVGKSNARLNAAGTLVHTVIAGGVENPEIRAFTPSELVIANILAKPLCQMKAGLAAAVAPGGHLILSGITVDQERRLLGSYGPFGLVFQKCWRLDGWSTLLLARPHA
ncbi:MAG: 50S ribosomal protein L11 methyltransferase [Pseudomonadota bacterium]